MEQSIFEGFPLSAQQRHLWLAQKERRALPVQCAARLRGPLDRALFKAALNRVVESHEILRTTFESPQSIAVPLQVMGARASFEYRETDLGHLDAAGRESAIERLFREDGARPFDLRAGPVVRFTLLSRSADDHVLLISQPPVCADALSLRNLLREISAAYRAPQRPPAESDEPVQYADFSDWQGELLASPENAAEVDYWRQRRPLFYADVTLNCEREPAPPSGFEPRAVTLPLDPEVAAAAAHVAGRYKTSAEIFFLACWLVLLWSYTNRREVVVGRLFDGRKLKDLRGALGPFARYLPVRPALEEGLRFGDLLAVLAASTLADDARQDYFSHELCLRDGPEEAGRVALPVRYEFEEWEAEGGPGPDFELLKLWVCPEVFKLRLRVVRDGGGVRCEVHYDASRYEAADIRRLASSLEALVRSAAGDPALPVERLDLLDGEARRQLLREFNGTRADFPRDACVHELFEAQASRTPDATAVVSEDRRLTYAELNGRANRLARYLQKQGVGPDVRVGVCMDRAAEMLVAVLGILKAGGAYVPLDPGQPQPRLSFMMGDAQVRVLLTQQALAEGLASPAAEVLCLDRDWRLVAAESDEATRGGARPENLAYVIYTSGSTGHPKGAMIRHRAVANLFTALRRTVYAGRDSALRVSLNAPLAFDASVKQVVQLCAGSSLHIVPEWARPDGQELLSFVRRERLDVLDCTPAQLRLILDALGQVGGEFPPGLVLVGGEAVDEPTRERIAALPGTSFFNVYGPTECTVDVTALEMKAGAPAAGIGRPLPNVQTYLLDRLLRPVPVGVDAELHVGGEGLARGYLGRPALTAEKFIPHPFAVEPGARLYRTGDLARYRADGELEYVGRADSQVKLRGFRVELGEIEATLGAHPEVRACAVLAREDVPGEKRLVAYVVPRRRHATSGGELHHFLREKLPVYMIPSVFVPLDRLPLTRNGKVDRRALPAPTHDRLEPEADYVAPRDPVEAALAGIWSEVLRVPRVGVDDNFFELGGDSIMSVQVIARAGKEGIKLTPMQLFQHQTVAGLAAVAGTTRLVAAEQGAVSGPVPLTPVQHWFFERDLARPHHYNQAVMLRLRQPVRAELLEAAVARLSAHHDALRMRFTRGEDGWRQFDEAAEAAGVFSAVDLSGVPEPARRAAVEAEAARLQQSLDLARGPLMRVALLTLSAREEPRLLVVVHHLIVDGVSWRILLEDLQEACRQLSAGREAALPPKTVSYRSWAESLREYARAAHVRQELDYWRAAERRQSKPLPLDLAGGANSESSTRLFTVTLGAEETQALLQEVPRVYRTQINDALLAALLLGFARWSGHDSLLLDLEGHGREEIAEGIDLSRTVGWFTSIFPVLLTLGDPDPGEVLKSVKEQLRRVPGRGVGYGVLKYLSEEPGVSDSLRELPPAQVSFNYLGQFDQVLDAGSLFAPDDGPTGPAHDPAGARHHLLEINGLVSGGRLQFDWAYSENVHRRSTIESLAGGFADALRAIIAHCRGGAAGGYTPSDFPDVKIDDRQLAAILKKTKKGGGVR